MNFGDEVLQHFFSDLKISNHAVLERSDRLNVARRAAQHPLGLFAHSLNRFLPVVHADCHNGGLIQNDAAFLDVNQCIRRAEINRQVGGKHPSEAL